VNVQASYIGGIVQMSQIGISELKEQLMGDNDQISQFLEDMGASSMMRGNKDEDSKVGIKKSRMDGGSDNSDDESDSL